MSYILAVDSWKILFLHVLMERMKEKIDTMLQESQFGFREGRGTIDAVFIVRQIIEKAKEKKIPIHIHFVDFKAAFDMVWRNALWKMMKSVGIVKSVTLGDKLKHKIRRLYLIVNIKSVKGHRFFLR